MALPSGKAVTGVKEEPAASMFMVQDGGSNFLRVVGKPLSNDAASRPRKP